MPYSMQQTGHIPNDPPRMGAKSTTTSNHPSSTPCTSLFSNWNYSLIDVAQVYGLAMIWELALKAVLGMNHI